ncbi:MAG: hypothetical protein Q7U04_02715 [Bacteriovorax sp.]|nr:hypothetical protein [Bacteriovorax sp.]
MTIKVMHSQSIFEEASLGEEYLGILDRYFLMRLHPRKMVFDSVGAIWAGYFLWNNNWALALSTFLVLGALGLFFTRKIDPDLMIQTTLGKIGLLHAHPINLTLNSIGVITIINGLWTHSAEIILVGLSVTLFGHFFGWSDVNSKLRMV